MASYLEFDIGRAIFSEYDKDSFPTVQIDAYGEEESGVVPYEQHSIHGLISRPHDPDTDGAGTPSLGCGVLYALDGGQGHAWVLDDPRILPLLPQVEKGGLCLYGGVLKNPSFHNIDGLTGTQIIYVPYDIQNDVAQKAMTFEINVDTKGQEAITMLHGSGAAFSIVESAGLVSATIKNAAGDAYLEVNDDGVVINGALTLNGSLNAGGPTAASPMAMGEPTANAISGMQTQLDAIGEFFAALAGAPTPYAPAALALGAAPGGKAMAAIAAQSQTVNAAVLLIKAKHTTGV